MSVYINPICPLCGVRLLRVNRKRNYTEKLCRTCNSEMKRLQHEWSRKQAAQETGRAD